MPLTGLFCKKKEQTVSFNECCECSKTNIECYIIPEYIKFITPDSEDFSSSISVTKVLNCPRRSYLLFKTDYIVYPEELYDMMRGSMGHLLLEENRMKDCIIETEFSREYKGIKVTGKPDKIDKTNGILYDYKTLRGRISDDLSLKWGNAHLHHQIQLNLYKWLIEDSIKINKMVLVYLGSDSILKIEVKERTPKNKKLWIPMEKAFERIEILGKYWDKEYSPEIVKKIPAERDWICKFCNVRKICEQGG